MHNYIQMNTTLTQITILNTFIESDFLTLPFDPTWKPCKNVWKSKLNAATQTPKQHTIFHQCTIFTKYLYFLRYGPISTSIPQIFSPSKFEFFGLKNPKFWTSPNPSEQIIPNPNWTKTAQRSWIDPHLDHETAVLLIDPACRCFHLGCFNLGHFFKQS